MIFGLSWADKNQMEQVLLNIYINAWQAMPDGGTVLIDARNIVLNSEFSKAFDIQPGRYVCVSISDTGIGIDPAIQTRIFEPFFTTKEMGRGTGLGLRPAAALSKIMAVPLILSASQVKAPPFIFICRLQMPLWNLNPR
ncbi:MAG: ATP-binding protein [Desulfobacterales bacterium]